MRKNTLHPSYTLAWIAALAIGCAGMPGSGALSKGVDSEINQASKETGQKQDGPVASNEKADSGPPQLTELPPAAMTDAELETEMVSIMQSKWASDKILKVVIVEGDWSVRQNALGYNTTRTIRTAVAVEQKAGKCRLFEVTFEQPATSQKTFADTRYFSVGGAKTLGCEAAL